MSARINRLLAAAAAAAAVSGGVLPQPEVASARPGEQLRRQIAEVQIETGLARPAGLVDPLRALAMLHPEAGDHALASAAFEEARYDAPGLRRYDDTRGKHEPPPGGTCHAPSGTPDVIRNLRGEVLIYLADAIETLVKNGAYASQELQGLEKQAVRTFPGWFETTTWLAGTERTAHAPRYTSLSLCTGICPATLDPGFGRAFIDHPAKLESDETLDELLASELLASCLEPVVHSNEFVTANVGGWVSLVRLIAYEVRSGAPPAARAKAFADLAHWCLLFTPAERRGSYSESSEQAIDLYERAQQCCLVGKSLQLFTPSVVAVKTAPTS